jgi:hypothetical protein
MTGPPNGEVPARGPGRHSHPHQGEPAPAGSGTEDSRTVRDLTDIPGWEAFARWLGAVT